MKFLTKLDITLLLLLLLSMTVKSKKILPEWDNDIIEIQNSTTFKAKSIISYALDNSTDSILYLGNMNGNYNLFLNKININNPFPNDITSIDSPLISFNKEYFFCSTKYFFKINSNNEISKISFPTFIDLSKYDDYSIKYIHYSKQKVAILIFINTPYAISYKLTESKWNEGSDLSYVNLDGIILTAQVYDSTASAADLLLFTKNQNNYYFTLYQFNNNNFNSIENRNINGENDKNFECHSKTEISFINWDTIALFTYNINSNNEFKYYLINRNEGKITFKGSKNYLREFNGHSFKKVKFVDNTGVICYLTENTITKTKYIGIVDLEYSLVLNNMEVDYVDNFFFDNGYLNDQKAFLNYFENGIEKQICPFIPNKDNVKCQIKSSSNKLFYINNKNGLNVNSFNTGCSYFKIGEKYCVRNCPVGYINLDNFCKLCNKFFNYGTNTCSDSCNFDYENTVCYDCKNNNQLLNNYDCISECNEIYSSGDISNGCTTCQSQGKYFDSYSKNCNDTCPEYSAIFNNNNECMNCKLYSKYYLESENRCVKKCPNYYVTNNSTYNCEICPDNLYYLEGSCVSECEKGYVFSKVTINNKQINICQNCQEQFKVYFDKKCYNSCSEASSTNIYTENGICVDKCSIGYELNKETKECESCKAQKLNYYDGECISKKCENLYRVNEDYICVDCKEKYDLFFQEEECVANCGSNYMIDQKNKICFKCSKSTFYFEANCVNECPEKTVMNDTLDYCYTCPSDKKYFNNECIGNCEPPYIEKIEGSNHYCVYCDNQTWFQGNKCSDKCQENAYLSDLDHSCHTCHCLDGSKCNENSPQCSCQDSAKNFGLSCEFSSDKNINDKKLIIVPINNKATYTGISLFTFKFNEESDIIKEKKYFIKWKLSIASKEITNNNLYKTYIKMGVNEEIFGVNPNIFSDSKTNRIDLTISDINNNKVLYTDTIYIKIQKNSVSPTYEIENSGSETIKKYTKIKSTNFNNMEQIQYFHKFFLVDNYNEELPLTSYQNDKFLTTYSLPASKYLINIKDYRDEIVQITFTPNKQDEYQILEDLDSISKIVDSDKSDVYSIITKMFTLKAHFETTTKKVDQEDFDTFINFIVKRKEELINENGYYIENTIEKIDKVLYYKYLMNYAEPKLLFSLINSFIQNKKEYLSEDNFRTIYEYLDDTFKILFQFNNNTNSLSDSDLKSLFRTIDSLVDLSLPKFEGTNIEIAYKLFNSFNKYLSLKMYPGEGTLLVGKTVTLFNYHFGRSQNLISIPSFGKNDQINNTDLKSYVFEDYGFNEDKCQNNEDTLLCLDKDYFLDLKNQLDKNGMKTTDLVLNLFSVNNLNNLDKEDINNYYIMNFTLFDINKKEYLPNDFINQKMFYYIELPFENKKYKKDEKLSFISSEEELFKLPYNYSNIVCYPKDYPKNPKYYCLTHFNYKSNKIRCSCNIIGPILIEEKEDYAEFYKNLQFQSIGYNYMNKSTIIFVFLILFLLLIPGAIFLIYDLYKDNKLLNKRQSFKERRRENYLKVKKYSTTGIFGILSFTILIALNKFLYFSPFNTNNYNSPKYTKHLINITGILLGFVLVLIPFIFMLPFEERQILMDKRDVEINDDEIHSIRFIDSYTIIALIFSFFSMIIVDIFISYFTKKLSIDDERNQYFKKIKDLCNDFVYNEVKKKIYLGKNWIKIKKRVNAVFALCGQYILNKNITNHPERNKKYENYLLYTGKSNKKNNLNYDASLKLNPQLKTDSKNEPLLFEMKDNNNNSINNDNNEKDNLKDKSSYNPPIANEEEIINSQSNLIISKSINQNNSNIKHSKVKGINKNFKIVKTDNFKFDKNSYIEDNISQNTINRFEKIRNRYMFVYKSGPTTEKKRKSKSNNEIKKYSIYYANNLSFFNVNSYSLINNANISAQASKKLSISICLTICLWIIFALLLLISIFLIKKLMNGYEYFIIKTWLWAAVAMIIVANFVLYLIKMFIGTILLFACYRKRKKGCFGKTMFYLFVDRPMIYIYKIRNYITKYKRDFINI